MHHPANYVSWWGVSLHICVLKQGYRPTGIKIKSTLIIDHTSMQSSSEHSDKYGLQRQPAWVLILDPPLTTEDPEQDD